MGAVPKKQPGDACEPGAVVYRVTRASGAIAFVECAGAPGEHAWVETTRALTATERADVETRMQAIVYDAKLECNGYDGLLISMVTTDKAGKKQLYVHENVNCYKDDRRRALGVKSLFYTLSQLPRSAGADEP